MNKITVYSTTTCPYCKMLVSWLSQRGVDYTEYKVDQNPIAAQEMIRQSGQMSVPFTTVEDADGKITKVLGFDVPTLTAVLGAA